MSFDMNDAEPQKSGELIPDGTFAKVTMTIRPGGTDGQSEIDRGLLKASNAPGSDVLMVDAEFTVAEGPHVRRKFWQMFTVSGGKVDEHGVSIGWKISKGSFRAMIDSALGLDPQDMSEAAKAKRILRGLADLNGITFVAKIKVEASEDARYSDQNRLDRVVLPNEKEWKLVMDGKEVPASPSALSIMARKVLLEIFQAIETPFSSTFPPWTVNICQNLRLACGPSATVNSQSSMRTSLDGSFGALSSAWSISLWPSMLPGRMLIVTLAKVPSGMSSPVFCGSASFMSNMGVILCCAG